jgi:hypothetical protein
MEKIKKSLMGIAVALAMAIVITFGAFNKTATASTHSCHFGDPCGVIWSDWNYEIMGFCGAGATSTGCDCIGAPGNIGQVVCSIM